MASFPIAVQKEVKCTSSNFSNGPDEKLIERDCCRSEKVFNRSARMEIPRFTLNFLNQDNRRFLPTDVYQGNDKVADLHFLDFAMTVETQSLPSAVQATKGSITSYC